MLESYRFGTLHPISMEVAVRVRRGVRQAFITRRQRAARSRGAAARSPCACRCATPATAGAARERCACASRSTRPTGQRTLRLIGTPADAGSDPNQEDGGDLSLVFEEEDDGAENGGPQSLAEIRATFLDLERYDGVVSRLGGEEHPLLRDPRLRISGEARVSLRIR